jgi:hypothetical protein
MFNGNFILLQQWYRYQSSIDQRIRFTLSENSFNAWKAQRFHAKTTPKTTMEKSTDIYITNLKMTSEVNNIQRSIKRTAAYFTNLKDDTRWMQWHRQLKATVNSH